MRVLVPLLLVTAVAAVETDAAGNAALKALKHGVFPALIQFQSGNYADANGDGIGDFGFLSEMAGGANPGGHTLQLLPVEWNAATPLIGGYRFAVYLAAGEGVSATPDERDRAKRAEAQLTFVAYAWPEGDGERMFALNAQGHLYEHPFAGEPPAWDALWNAPAWTGTVAWTPAQAIDRREQLRAKLRGLPDTGVTAPAAAPRDPAAPPLATLVVGDGVRLRRHVDASLYATLWRDPALAEVRLQAADSLARAGRNGLELEAMWEALESGGVALLGFGGQPASALSTSGFDVGQRTFAAIGLPDRAADCAVSLDLGPRGEELFDVWRGKRQLVTPTTSDGVFHLARSGPQVARQGGRLVIATGTGPLPAWTPATAATSDLALACDLDALFAEALSRAPDEGRRALLGMRVFLAPWWGTIAYHGTLTPTGVSEQAQFHLDARAFAAVDRAALDRLPADVLAVLAVGIDGPGLWSAMRAPLCAAIAANESVLPEDAEEWMDLQLSEDGLPGISELIRGCHGTFALVVTPGEGWPGVTLIAPRTATTDQVAAVLAKQLGVELPAEGAGVGGGEGGDGWFTLARDQRFWTIGTDPDFDAGDWATSTTGAAALPRVDGDTVLIGASDTPALLRSLSGFLPMLGVHDANHQAVVARACELTVVGTALGRATPEGYTLAVDGAFGLGVIPALTGLAWEVATAEPPVTGTAAGAMLLTSQLFPAEIQFQAGEYVDANENGIGDYGFPSEMAGAPLADDLTLSLLPPAWNAAEPTVDGWRFKVWLPDGVGGACDTPAARAAAKGPGDSNFVAYAWPAEPDDDAVVLAITSAGTVFVGPWTGTPPTWNALWNGGGWSDAPAWPHYQSKP